VRDAVCLDVIRSHNMSIFHKVLIALLPIHFHRFSLYLDAFCYKIWLVQFMNMRMTDIMLQFFLWFLFPPNLSSIPVFNCFFFHPLG
jgi:hypothetical protein